MTHPRSISLAMLRRSRPDIAQVADWLDTERSYAEAKWSVETADRELVVDPELYAGWVKDYLHRALTLGLDNPLGRQALAKSLRTLLAFCEAVVRQIGPLPPAGVPSGQLTDTPRSKK